MISKEEQRKSNELEMKKKEGEKAPTKRNPSRLDRQPICLIQAYFYASLAWLQKAKTHFVEVESRQSRFLQIYLIHELNS